MYQNDSLFRESAEILISIPVDSMITFCNDSNGNFVNLHDYHCV